MNSEKEKDKVLVAIFEIGWDGEKSTATTKEIASKIGYTTQLTYTLCKELQSEGKLISIGYNLGKGIWEDVNNSKNHFKSLTWQII